MSIASTRHDGMLTHTKSNIIATFNLGMLVPRYSGEITSMQQSEGEHTGTWQVLGLAHWSARWGARWCARWPLSL
jgi:hypothetical protein